MAAHQVHKGGSVIMMQLENELDFFDCPDPAAYMASLAGLARRHGMEVPLFGCAGQGSAMGATGFAEDVVPKFNFYPNAGDPSFDQVCHFLGTHLREKKLPYLITETGREHFLLRREMAFGARLLGAYNQVGGTNFGFTPATTHVAHDIQVKWENAPLSVFPNGILIKMNEDGALLCLENSWINQTRRKSSQGKLLLYAEAEPCVLIRTSNGETHQLKGFGQHQITSEAAFLKMGILTRQEAVQRDIGRGKMPPGQLESTESELMNQAVFQPAPLDQSWKDNAPSNGRLLLEHHGVWRGAGQYHARARRGAPVLLQGAAEEWRSMDERRDPSDAGWGLVAGERIMVRLFPETEGDNGGFLHRLYFTDARS